MIGSQFNRSFLLFVVSICLSPIAIGQSCSLSSSTSTAGSEITYTYTLACTAGAAPSQLALKIPENHAMPQNQKNISFVGYSSGAMNFNGITSPGTFQIVVQQASTSAVLENYYVNLGAAAVATLTSTTPAGQVSVPEDTVSPSTFQALVGVGSRIGGPGVLSYTQSNNVLSTENIGRSTPQILVGGSFQLFDPDRRKNWHWDCLRFIKNANKCTNSVLPLAPTSVFVNLQIAPNSSDVLNGYTFGGGFALKKNVLDLLLGYSLSPNNEPSPGFVRVAASTVQNNPSIYPTFNAQDILNNKPGALDGFPTLQNQSAANQPPVFNGSPIFNGNILTTHYRGGFFIGLGFPLNIFKLFESQ